MFHAQQNSPLVLKITRVLQACREEVFDAWTNPESMRAWMCPKGASVSLVELDLRVGGGFRIDMHYDNEDTVHTGTYREISPPEKLVFTWVSEQTHYRESLVTIQFLAHGDATELILTQQQLPDEQTVREHSAGWAALAEHLVIFLQKKDTRH
jgi:uncharacterized protein YndB with AHSA1/START domain